MGNGITKIVGESGYYTVAMIAKACGKSADTVDRWVKQGKVSPPEQLRPLGTSGTAYVRLFSEQQLQECIAYSKTTRPGRRKQS